MKDSLEPSRPTDEIFGIYREINSQLHVMRNTTYPCMAVLERDVSELGEERSNNGKYLPKKENNNG